jgi:glycosyltransferase involved in cell wall biosynthesis
MSFSRISEHLQEAQEHTPKVSVIMSVYNGARYLREAVDSILSQTFTDFECVIIDDGSTDETSEILHSYDDPRLVLMKNEANIGLTKSLNKGLQAARGQYIARQDADDVSCPGRLRAQVEFLDSHPAVGAVSSSYVLIDGLGNEIGVSQVPTDNVEIQKSLLFSNALCHGSAMFRRTGVEAVGLYREDFELAQDCDLWLRLSEHYDLANIPTPLYKFRSASTSASVTKRLKQLQFVRRAVEEALQRRLNNRNMPASRHDILAGFYLHLAREDFATGEVDAARLNLERAFAMDPQLMEETGFILEALAYRAFDVYRTSQAADSGDGIKVARQYLQRVFANLPPAASSLASEFRRTLSQFYIIAAFENYWAGVFSETRRCCILGVLYDPRWLRNRGVISIFSRSLFRQLVGALIGSIFTPKISSLAGSRYTQRLEGILRGEVKRIAKAEMADAHPDHL